MVTALKRTVTVQPGGLVEVRLDELPPGAFAEVIVLVEQSNTQRNAGASRPTSLQEQLRLAAVERYEEDRAIAQE